MGLYSDMVRQTYGDPTESFSQPTGMTSDQAVDRYRYASLNGVDPRDVTQEMVDRYKAEKVFEGTGPVFQEKMQNPVFKAAVQGQEKQVASVEQTLMGISSKDSNITTKAFARGAADLVQVKNGFSAYQLRNEIDTIKQELKAKPDDPRLKERLDIKYREAKKLAESIADYARISKAFNEGSYKQKVESGDYDALDMLGSIWEAIVQSMTTNAPALAGTAVATATLPVSGTAAVLGAGAGLTALGSGSIDYALGLVGKMSESGIDVTDAESVKYYLTDDSRFHENQMGSARHAAAVGAFDAASFVIGGKAARSALEGVRPGVPVTAALLMNAQKNGVAKTIGHGIVQGQIQGLMGAAGEATGQILDTGEITDTMGIFYEYAAEVGMSPVETTIAAYGAQRDAAIRARRAEFNKQVLAATTEAARTTPALQESDEIRDMYLQEIEAAHPEFGHITVDLNSLHQSHPDVIDSIIAALPDKEAEIRKELALGGAVELSLDEYARITKEEEAAQAILDSTSLADDQTVLDAQAAEKDIAESRKFAINRFAQGQSKEWFDDYMGVAAQVNDVLKTEKGSRDTTERSALLSLTLSHIANMAKDAGMLPSEIWNTYGIKAVLRGGEATYDENGNIVAQDGVDIVRDKNGNWYAVSQRGQSAVGQSSYNQIRTKPDPKKTRKVFKLMRIKRDADGNVELDENGQPNLYPLYIDANNPIHIGRWYDADSPDFSALENLSQGDWLVDTKTGEAISYEDYAKKVGIKRPSAKGRAGKADIDYATKNGLRWMRIVETPAGVKTTTAMKRYGVAKRFYNLGINGGKGGGAVTEYALRPGWHAGSAPSMTQVGGGVKQDVRMDDQIWVEGEVPMDIDYDSSEYDAIKSPEGDMIRLPVDGTYTFATNPKKAGGGLDWVISGAFKPVRVLSDAEAAAEVDRQNAEETYVDKKDGKEKKKSIFPDFLRAGGRKFNAETMRIEEGSLHQGSFGEFIPSTNTIIRWANADRSTLLHETGHWFLKARVDLAVRLKAQGNLTEQQQHLVDSIEKTVKWLGAKDLESFAAMDLDSSRDMQEKFATTYEQYLKDGHAPNHGLMTIFRKFSGWLRRVYGTLAQVPGSQMSPDVKELFDNLFVSHEQVREAQLRRNLFLALDSIPRNPNDAITHSAAAKALNAMFRDIDDAAVENYNSRGTKVIGYVRRLHDRVFTDLTKQAKKIRAQIENEEIMRVLGPQRAEAIRRISEGIPTLSKAGQLRHVKPQIYIKELIALGATTEEIEALRAQGLVTDTNGVHATEPQVFATFTGYSSLDAFIDDFGTDPFEGKKPDEFVKDIVDQRMYDEHPELADKESIADTADAAVFNPTAASVMAMEINFLEGANGRPVSMDLFKAVAEAELRHKKVKDLSAYKFRQAAERLGRRARALLSEGNLKGAASVKRQQLVQTQKAIRAQELKDQTEKFVKTMLDNFRGKKTSNSMQLDYLKQVSSILASIGVIPESIQNTPTWAEFCAAESVYTFLPQMPNVVASSKQFDEMTATEAIETMEFMRDLVAAARERYSVIVGERKESLELIDAEQAAAIEKNAADKGLKPVPQNERNHDRSLRVQHAIREFQYNHARFHTLWAVFEGTKFGTFFERFGKRIDAARDRANELKYEKTKAYYEAMQKLKAAIGDRTKRHYRTLGGSFDKEQMISIALNIGNDSNFERLLDGSDKYVDFRDQVPGQELSKWTRQDVLTAISEALTFDELSTIQEIWNICGSLGDELQALDARTRNKQVDKVEPKAVTLQTADGKAIALAGGYFPVSYDKYGSNFESGANFVEGLNQSMPQGTRNSDTGHSIERNRLNGNPIALTPNAGYETLNDIINDICYREVLVDLNKLIAPKTKTRHAIQTYFGKEAITEIQNWMNDVASGGKSIPSNKWENLIRKNVSIAGLGFNPVTALLQPLGMTQSAAVVGGKWCAKGMIELFGNPHRSVHAIMTKSSMMRSRMRTRFKELSEVQTQFDGTKNSFQDWMARAAFKPIVIMQMTTVDMPTWLGAYQRFLAEGKAKNLSGAELEDFAVSRADRSVIDAQGSGDLADLARVERKKSIWNVFYSFFGTVLNACVVSGKTEKGVERAMSLLLILGVQPVIESFLRAGIDAAAGDPDDYDEILMKRLPADLVSFPMGMFVYGREFSPAVAKAMGNNPYDYSGPAGTRTFSDAVKLGAQIYQGEIDKGLVKATANFSADLLGLPATELSRIVDTIDAIDRGKDVTPLNFLFGYKGK